MVGLGVVADQLHRNNSHKLLDVKKVPAFTFLVKGPLIKLCKPSLKEEQDKCARDASAFKAFSK